MTEGVPKIDLEKMRARLGAGVDRALQAADTNQAGQADSAPDTQSLRQEVSPVLEGKSGSRKRNIRKENDWDSDMERVRTVWIRKTEEAIAEAKSLEQLMKMVISMEGKGKKKLSFSLPEGLPLLLKNNKDFSREFNMLLDKWSERVAEMLFSDEERITRFQAFMRDTVKNDPKATRGDVFNGYLNEHNFLVLGEVPSVVVRMKELWKQFLPAIKQELKAGKSHLKEIAVGSVYVLRSDPSKEHTITGVSADGEITYVPAGGMNSVTSSREKFLRYLRPKSIRLEARSKNAKPGSRKKVPIDIDDALSDIRNNGNGRSDEHDEMRKTLRRQQSVSGNNGVSIPDTSRVVGPDHHTEPSMRSYDDLMDALGETKRGASLERKRLESAVAAGLQEIEKILPDEDRLNTYIREDKDQLISDFSAQIIIRLQKLSWTSDERESFAKTFVAKSIEDFLT